MTDDDTGMTAVEFARRTADHWDRAALTTAVEGDRRTASFEVVAPEAERFAVAVERINENDGEALLTPAQRVAVRIAGLLALHSMGRTSREDDDFLPGLVEAYGLLIGEPDPHAALGRAVASGRELTGHVDAYVVPRLHAAKAEA